MKYFPPPHLSKFPWIGLSASARRRVFGDLSIEVQYLISNADRIEMLGGLVAARENQFSYRNERAIVRVVNVETSEVEYFALNNSGDMYLPPFDAPQVGVRWNVNYGPSTRDDLAAWLSTSLTPGSSDLLLFISDEFLGF